MAKSQTKAAGRKPTHRLYIVTGDGENAKWLPVGAAWPHEDGNGFGLSVEALPLQGRIVLRRIAERADTKQSRE